MRRIPLSAVVLAVALIVQLTVVNRLTLPGGGAPDLVLLAVVALALADGPAAGAITGFCAGLCLDVAPPTSYIIGRYALVFCIVGYLCGELRGTVAGSALEAMIIAALAAVVGEAMQAALGLMLRDPQVTWPAVRQVLPSTAAYDAALAPLVLYLIMIAVRVADGIGRPEATADTGRLTPSALLARVRAAGSLRSGIASPAAAASPGTVGLLGGGGWLAGPQTSPRLGDFRMTGGWIGGVPRTWRSPGRPGPGRRTVRFRPGSGQPGSAVARPSGPLPRRPVSLRFGGPRRRGGGVAGTARGAADGVARRSAGPGPPGSAFSRGSRRGAAGQAGRAARNGSARGPRFRPDRSPRGGSASGAVRRTAPPRPPRPARLRFGPVRRRDGVVGGSVLAAGRGRPRTASAKPRFRAHPAGGAGASASRARFRAGKRARFRFGGSTMLSGWTGGRLGGRSTVWRIGGGRAASRSRLRQSGGSVWRRSGGER